MKCRCIDLALVLHLVLFCQCFGKYDTLEYTCESTCIPCNCKRNTVSDKSSCDNDEYGQGTDLCDCCPACYLAIGETCIKFNGTSTIINQKCQPGAICSLSRERQDFICTERYDGVSPKFVSAVVSSTNVIKWHVVTPTIHKPDTVIKPVLVMRLRVKTSMASEVIDELLKRYQDTQTFLPSTVLFPSPSPSINYRHINCRACECKTIDRKDCLYGLANTPDVCCPECARGPNERCGGLWAQYGHCLEGYRCNVTVPFRTSYNKFQSIPGRCLPGDGTTISTDSYYTFDSPTITSYKPPVKGPKRPKQRLSTCRETCSIDFCRDGSNRYCSATGSIALNAMDKRNPCQHTTCRACYLFVKPQCKKCPKPVTKRCMRHFGLCLNAFYTLAGTQAYLSLHNPEAVNATGKVFCFLPELS